MKNKITNKFKNSIVEFLIGILIIFTLSIIIIDIFGILIIIGKISNNYFFKGSYFPSLFEYGLFEYSYLGFISLIFISFIIAFLMLISIIGEYVIYPTNKYRSKCSICKKYDFLMKYTKYVQKDVCVTCYKKLEIKK